MNGRKTLTLAALGTLLAAGGVGTGWALSDPNPNQTPTTTAATTSVSGADQTAPTWMTSYSGYATMMGRYGAMMGTSGGMMGGAGAYGQGSTMYSGTDMGRIMGRALANQPGPRISTAQADTAATAVPSGAHVDAAHNTVTFTTQDVTLTVVASPSDTTMYRFETAGLIDPTISVPAGAHVTLRLINADTDMAHGIVVTASGTTASWMPMMTAAPAYAGAEIWALGEAGSTGAPEATTTFTAAAAGTYTYLCPIPGHAQQGMEGTLTVR